MYNHMNIGDDDTMMAEKWCRKDALVGIIDSWVAIKMAQMIVVMLV